MEVWMMRHRVFFLAMLLYCLFFGTTAAAQSSEDKLLEQLAVPRTVKPFPMVAGKLQSNERFCGQYFLFIKNPTEQKLSLVFSFEDGHTGLLFFNIERFQVRLSKQKVPTVEFINQHNEAKVRIKLSRTDYDKADCLQYFFPIRPGQRR
jgi:hypothetical protein